MFKSRFKNTVYRWRVRACFIGLILAILLSRPNLYSLFGGVGLCSLGLLLRTWASGHLKKEKELTISGPYQFTRNPLYLANFIIGISVILASYSWWMVGVFVAYFILFYPVTLLREKEKMNTLFPEEYEKYKKRVPFFFPSFKSLLSSNKNKFSWKLYKKNKEYKALLGAVLFWLIMTAKMIFFL